jgi:hypothetical protein
LLCGAGCALLEDEIPPAVMPVGKQDITVSPPARITFDDMEPVTLRYRPVFGSTDLIHRGDNSCCTFGRCTGARWPAVVDVAAVFAKIPEYERLQKGRYAPEEPDYILLLTSANERFADALGQYLEEAQLYDTVFERGSVRLRADSKAKGIPDVTEEVIKRLRK